MLSNPLRYGVGVGVSADGFWTALQTLLVQWKKTKDDAPTSKPVVMITFPNGLVYSASGIIPNYFLAISLVLRTISPVDE